MVENESARKWFSLDPQPWVFECNLASERANALLVVVVVAAAAVVVEWIFTVSPIGCSLGSIMVEEETEAEERERQRNMWQGARCEP